jgi:DNA polymerase V
MYSQGFPSPAEHEWEKPLSLDRYLIAHPLATFFVRAKGERLTPYGIHDGDILVVDRAVTPRVGDWVVAVVDGELTVVTVERGKALLVWGVVVGLVRKLR